MARHVAFAPDSAIRQIHNEGVLLLGGGRALLMQLAHPSVAAAVAEHSDYRSNRLRRLLDTLRPMYAIAFGTPTQAYEAAQRVNALHGRVRGATYRATDPELLAWVLATLIDSALVVHSRFLRPLGPDEAERYYRDMLRVGTLLRIPDGAMPSDVPGFHRYFGRMADSLAISDEARLLARALFEPLPGSGPLMPLTRELTAGLLPPRLRHEYGFGWGPTREALLDVTASVSRRVLPLVPTSLRRPPSFLLPPNVT